MKRFDQGSLPGSHFGHSPATIGHKNKATATDLILLVACFEWYLKKETRPV